MAAKIAVQFNMAKVTFLCLCSSSKHGRIILNILWPS